MAADPNDIVISCTTIMTLCTDNVIVGLVWKRLGLSVYCQSYVLPLRHIAFPFFSQTDFREENPGGEKKRLCKMHEESITRATNNHYL